MFFLWCNYLSRLLDLTSIFRCNNCNVDQIIVLLVKIGMYFRVIERWYDFNRCRLRVDCIHFHGHFWIVEISLIVILFECIYLWSNCLRFLGLIDFNMQQADLPLVLLLIVFLLGRICQDMKIFVFIIERLVLVYWVVFELWILLNWILTCHVPFS